MSSKAGIPETIKLGDNEYVVKDNPELMKIIEGVRKQEKDKLYSTITSLEAKAKVLEDEKKVAGTLSTTNEEKLKNLQDEIAVTNAEKKKLEELVSKAKKGDDDDDDSDKEGKQKTKTLSAEDVSGIIAAELKKQREEFDKEISEVKNGMTQKSVSDYRKEQIKKHEGLVIAELIPTGLGSEEAVNKAIQSALETSKDYIQKEYDIDGKKSRMSLREYEKYEAENNAGGGKPDDADDKGNGKKGKEGEDGKGTPNYKAPSAPKRPDQGDADITNKQLLSKVENMSDAEYEKHRETILKEAKQVKYEDE